ncbi:MAG: hypothetical protein CVT63_01200 [Candidatus Anoxymicrobium japonicum]|uniref:Uncharacterized protein n=1 Tax=Candidatus Anoxymicrobium japonicum TaxID=2013648 RepID=A0A2N3G7U1_9ACTN|nr:MAG: hypothetical protein CVT63_01200 [Candidatus Anoxymicrobium japonicum]
MTETAGARHNARNHRKTWNGFSATITACVVSIMLCAVFFPAGCNRSAAIKNYVALADEILFNANASETELKKFWTLPVSEQGGIVPALAQYRDTLAESQEKLDVTDSPDPCRPLDDLLGKVVAAGRTLADITTQFADYLESLAPPAREAAEIVGLMQALDKSQDVPSSVAGLAERARKLGDSLRTVTPPASLQQTYQKFQEFVETLVKNLDEANKKLGGVNEGAQMEDEEDADNAQNKRQISSIEQYVDEVVEEWGRTNGELNALLDQARETTGLKQKTTEVESYVVQAVEQIKTLKKTP